MVPYPQQNINMIFSTKCFNDNYGSVLCLCFPIMVRAFIKGGNIYENVLDVNAPQVNGKGALFLFLTISVITVWSSYS